jgi:methylenetetrahydrofolate--tRNA-(uracil-5-)-methyltransferase
MDKAWIQSRWNKTTSASKEGGDYINCPMTQEQYEAFVQGLIDAEKGDFKEWEAETPYFDGCMPIEVMAERGIETLRYGPMKGVGLDNPRDTSEEHPQGKWPYAVVQLRQDNKLGTLWNMVGFQTKMKYGAQVDLFRTIPGLENAEFARLGGMHRNTFINSPELLDRQLRLKNAPHIRFAGQVTGCEGYVESSAVGLMAGMMAAAELSGEAWSPPPATSAMGALLSHITGDADASHFQPMNVNFGLFPPMHEVKKKQRKEAYTNRAKADFGEWLATMETVPA